MTTIKAIEERVRRKLAQEGKALCQSRTQAEIQEFGEYYTKDIQTNSIEAWHIDLMAWAKELKVLRPGEEVE